MGAYALEVATRIDRRQCVAQIAGGCLGAEVGMPKASTHDALAFVGDGTRAVCAAIGLSRNSLPVQKVAVTPIQAA
jgi:hypothetical protein